MHRVWIVASVAACAVATADARQEPLRQETVEVQPWRTPSRPGVQPRHHHAHPAGRGHNHGAGHAHRRGDRHDRPSEAHERLGEDNGHKHQGVETEHLFGFTKGSDIDAVGSKHFIADLTGRFGKQRGTYAAASQHFELGFTPWRDVHIALGAALAAHRISGVDDVADRRQVAFEGLSFEARYRLLDRMQAPFGLTLVAEPHWARVDEVDGQRATKFAIEFTLAADKELIKDRLYGAVNLIYEPEWVRLKASGEIERESTIGLSLAAMTPIWPSVFAGGELRYLRG